MTAAPRAANALPEGAPGARPPASTAPRARPGPLAGKTALITRPKAQAEPLASLLRRAGGRVILAPLIRIASPSSTKGLDRSILGLAAMDRRPRRRRMSSSRRRGLEGCGTVVFTSANAARAFFARAGKLGRLPLPRPRALFAVGESTARVLESLGWKGARVPRVHRAEDLAKAMGRVEGETILLPGAKAGRDVLPRELRRKGAKVSVVEAYRTLPDPAGRRRLERAALGGVDVVVFMSGSAVREFQAALPAGLRRRFLARAQAASIGPVTSAAMAAAGIKPAIEAKTASAAALAGAIVRYYRGRRRHA
ncbi:MAG: uroporphyrinogen-III synthase [Elusimicrobia bacterium]|nr:uroporphyrinogen-III synthase [Elusimicrobiota bacterium]